MKLRKSYTYGSGKTNTEANITTDYLDGFHYEGSVLGKGDKPMVLKFLPTAEGYYDFENNAYIYHYKDHLGNIRLSYKNSGVGVEIVEEHHYYSFGLRYGTGGTYNTYKYQFQGQEQQEETGWYSFKWRNYDPSFGRFFGIDPLSEKYAYQSHYNFSENQVVAFVELEGLERGLPWYLNENKHGAKPVFTLGAHHITFPYAERKEYSGNVINKAGAFVSNVLGSIYNGVASSWNEAMAGKAGSQMMIEGDRATEFTLRDAERNGLSMEHIEVVASTSLTRKVGKIYKVPGEQTLSGKPYIGRTKQESPKIRGRGAKDGRDRGGKTEIIDTYDPNNIGEGSYKEQKAINREGGINKLDNKRNEVSKKRRHIQPPSAIFYATNL